MSEYKKQIEEMAKLLHDGNAHRYADWVEYTNADLTLALKLYNAGYRKISENEVVLTQEELEHIQSNSFDAGIKHGSKETAEKFAELVKMAFYYHFDELIPSIMADKIDEICKEIAEGKV